MSGDLCKVTTKLGTPFSETILMQIWVYKYSNTSKDKTLKYWNFNANECES